MPTGKTTSKGHHLILGKVADYLTGEILVDTHDERLRQKVAKLLVEDKGYDKKDITPRNDLVVHADQNKGRLKIDFKVCLNGKTAMIIKYGPGSLVTRQRPAIAASRLLEPYQVPVVVVTNGKQADVMAGENGKVIGTGLGGILSKTELSSFIQEKGWKPVSPKRAGMESRIVYCYEIDDRCPCDDTICKL